MGSSTQANRENVIFSTKGAEGRGGGGGGEQPTQPPTPNYNPGPIKPNSFCIKECVSKRVIWTFF